VVVKLEEYLGLRIEPQTVWKVNYRDVQLGMLQRTILRQMNVTMKSFYQ